MMEFIRGECPADLGQQALLNGEAAAATACVGTAPNTPHFFFPFLVGGEDGGRYLLLPKVAKIVTGAQQYERARYSNIIIKTRAQELQLI